MQARLQQSVESCSKSITQHPLKQAHANGSFDAYYSCGFVLQMAVDAAARRASHGECGLACVWRDFLAQVAAGKPWTSETFIAVAHKRTDERTSKFLRTVVNEVVTQPQDVLREGLSP